MHSSLTTFSILQRLSSETAVFVMRPETLAPRLSTPIEVTAQCVTRAIVQIMG